MNKQQTNAVEQEPRSQAEQRHRKFLNHVRFCQVLNHVSHIENKNSVFM